MTVLFLFSTSAFATQAQVDDNLILCKNQRLVRTLRVDFDNSNKCMAIYNKNGEDKVIGSGQNPQSCLQFVNNVRDNLEGASWNCREVKDSRTSMVKPEGLE